ncbi:class III extradiol ring-cleavage dioxygenase [Desulfococcus sp.]|uniref:DODA-type extradiol aromatic ring-opening family dioxygenase n=1 Tax=Desulfococcus sp. TaxID=2025834 RepID=UPI003593D56E
MMPTLFISHGPPAVALMENSTAAFLRSLSEHLPWPEAIVCASAHWEAWRPMVTSAAAPATIYDFGGPSQLFQLRYPAPGSPDLAGEILALLAKNGIEGAADPDRGLDHGAWIPLMMAFPEADIPVIQVSIQTERDAAWHCRFGEAMAPLREKGVLVMGSGGAVHNLEEIGGYALDAPPPDYVLRFDEWLAGAAAGGEVDVLLDYRNHAPEPDRCHPWPAEHFLPFFVAMGAGRGVRARCIHQGFMYGTLSMAAYIWE